MKTHIEIEPQSNEDSELLKRIGKEAMHDFVMAAGHRVLARVLAHIRALGGKGDPDGKLHLMMRIDTDVELVNAIDSYQHIVDAATGETPAVDSLGFREYGAWIDKDVSYQVMYPMEHGDFARLDEGDQRTQLLLAAEILYGPQRDGEVLAEAVFWAKEPV